MDTPLKDQDSAALMLAYISGQPDAFTLLYDRHKGPLYRFILRQGFDPSTAEELFQEIWLKIIKARKNYSISAKFETWLYTIARNHLIDTYRKAGREIETLDVDEENVSREEVVEVDIDASRQKQQLLACVEALPFEQRQTFLLRQEAGLNHQDIAEITHTKAETVKSRLRYAMNHLKKQLGGSP